MFIQSHTRLPSSIFTQEVYIHEKTDLSCYGSRYGGLKQIDPVGSHGEVIMDYSLYDARRAGFERVIFIIKHSIEKDFHEAIGARIANYMDVSYAYQDLEDLPEGYTVPDGREKPWGTCHAILAARDLIDAPFAVINADDYYSTTCFQIIYDYLSTHSDDDKYRYCMVGYQLKNTVTETAPLQEVSAPPMLMPTWSVSWSIHRLKRMKTASTLPKIKELPGRTSMGTPPFP